jgi:hypothetical protein
LYEATAGNCEEIERMNAIAGAAILAERFGASVDADRAAPLPPGALPIFHWIGVEPPASENQVEESRWPSVSDSSGS